jgi:hypothetical protein
MLISLSDRRRDETRRGRSASKLFRELGLRSEESRDFENVDERKTCPTLEDLSIATMEARLIAAAQCVRKTRREKMMRGKPSPSHVSTQRRWSAVGNNDGLFSHSTVLNLMERDAAVWLRSIADFRIHRIATPQKMFRHGRRVRQA